MPRRAARARRRHLCAGIRLNEVDTFLQACLQADEPTARRLLPALDALDAEGRAALAWAALRGRADSVRLMAALGFDLTWDGPGGGTPLHHAAWHGRPATVRVLLELGAPVDALDREFGASPLGWAAHGSANCRSADDDYCEVVEILLAGGASRAAATNRHGTPRVGAQHTAILERRPTAARTQLVALDDVRPMSREHHDRAAARTQGAG